jgi:hypothetical protein
VQVLFLHKKSIFIGRAEMDLSDLLTAKQIPSTTLTLVDEKTKKPSGGSVTVSACVRQPWNGQKVSIEMVILHPAGPSANDPVLFLCPPLPTVYLPPPSSFCCVEEVLNCVERILDRPY